MFPLQFHLDLALDDDQAFSGCAYPLNQLPIKRRAFGQFVNRHDGHCVYISSMQDGCQDRPVPGPDPADLDKTD